ncbi:P2 family phage major capsid protein [Aeromonas hydrophila]|uniref:P2 family phage major capsid protein n=1 Tax=Aeromonas hydrophila TaxID=644 RepID=UPI002B4AABAF|nr:P2 family phage major capsid protein [Aeromonas hydrophila]
MLISDLLRDMRMSFVPAPQACFGTLDPSTSSALSAAIVQATPFLSLLTVLGVDDPNAPLFDPIKAKLRTGRKAQGRFLVPATPTKQRHEYQDFDSSVIWTWQELAQLLAGMDERQTNKLLEGLALAAFGDDILRVGFRGQRAATNTDPVANPNGEDVAPGWPTLAKAADPEGKRVLNRAVVFDTTGGGDYADLDTMVYELVALLPEAYRNDPRLRVLVGCDLLRAHKQAYLKPGAVRDKQQRMKIADLPTLTSQHMPGTYLALTFTENLQVLTVNHSHRLSISDLSDDTAWGMRYNRAQAYGLGEPTAYAAFDAITLATTEE